MGTDVFLLTKPAGSNSIQRACSQARSCRPRDDDVKAQVSGAKARDLMGYGGMLSSNIIL